jgi:hypothetical protein
MSKSYIEYPDYICPICGESAIYCEEGNYGFLVCPIHGEISSREVIDKNEFFYSDKD